LGLLKEYELLHWLAARQPAPDDDDRARQLRSAIIEDAFVRRPMDEWRGFAELAEWTDVRCGGCNAPSRMAVLPLRVPGPSRRRVVMCPRCGVSEDTPEHMRLNLRFSLTDRRCAVAGTLPVQKWTGALIIRTRLEGNDRLWPWPAGPDGSPCPEMQVPEPIPFGPLKIAMIIVHRGCVAWAAMDTHGGPLDC
jgi:hypothetical protein